MTTQKRFNNSKKQFTSTVWVNKIDENGVASTLMHRHEKLGIWLPPGGKVEPPESKFDAALRELQEETGLRERDVEFLSGTIATGDRVNPFSTSDLPHLRAIDFGYLALLKTDITRIEGFEWFPEYAVEYIETNVNVKQLTALAFALTGIKS